MHSSIHTSAAAEVSLIDVLSEAAFQLAIIIVKEIYLGTVYRHFNQMPLRGVLVGRKSVNCDLTVLNVGIKKLTFYAPG